MIAEPLHQDIEPLHTADGMFDKDANLAHRLFLSPLCRRQLRIRIGLTFGWVLVGNLNPSRVAAYTVRGKYVNCHM